MEMSDVSSAHPSPLAKKDVDNHEEGVGEEQVPLANEKMESKMVLSQEDPTKVKFTNSNSVQDNNGVDAKVDIENVQIAFAGMGKEELMKYADDPFWVRLRWIFFILFWIVWLSMLIGAIVIVIMTPGCRPLPPRDWWQRTAVYQIYPLSFKDSNGDGHGDLKGIESKLDYIKDLGVKTIWISPIYKSPMADNGYDVSDFVDIDPTFGNLDDFKSLMNSTKAKDLKVVLDFVPNHSSDEHVWFEKSKNREENYTDYYIWRDGIGPNKLNPPNNWLSVFNGPAWTYDTVREQFYLHQFLPKQPDLNFRNPLVREEMKNVLRFWLDLGVAGFRIDALKHLVEREDLKDEPLSNDPNAKPDDYNYLSHEYTTNQPELFEVNREWRVLLDEYKEKDGDYRLLFAEVYDKSPQTMRYYGTNSSGYLNDFPLNFQLIDLNNKTTAFDLQRMVTGYLAAIPEGKWPNWVLGNHDNRRIGSRTHPDLVDGWNAITMLLGGTPFTYYGEEIGMQDVMIPFNETKDTVGLRGHTALDYASYSRDFERTPMQWSEEPNAGFTDAGVKPYLRISDDYKTNNVKVQLHDLHSHLGVYKKLVKLREEPAIIYGELCFIFATDSIGKVFSFARVKKGSPGFVVLVNLGANATVVDLRASSGCENVFGFPEDGTVEVSSAGGLQSYTTPAKQAATSSSPAKAVKVQLHAVSLGPRESLVIKFVPNIKAKG